MAKHGKKYREVKSKAPAEVLELDKAVDFLKANPVAKFDETAEMALRMGLDPRKSEQAVRGSVVLPHGTGRDVNVVVFAVGAAAEAAKEAGADEVGFEDLIEKVKGGWTDFDVAVATPEAMKEVRKLGRVLGPRGLMPNPKTGTVSDDTASAVQASKAGRVEFRMDRHANISVPFGKLSFPAENLVENARAVLAAVTAERPASAKGTYIKNCSIASSMGVGLRIDVRE
ncbi:MAG: 50S ribosomal protein L1 [Kiritimatiellia bacterium]|jgi:large subunit ribosomal protein L1|nr:50S ribosomal protein L1 [Kiritimatiellia bacterium]MDP6848056.1 50S ribosomal protein L1 [Kiritimatiellia bacterium]